MPSTSVVRRDLPPILTFGISRLVVVVGIATAAVLQPGFGPLDLFFDWDGAHYLYIATNGYPPLYPPGGGYLAHTAFFPMLPLLTWVLAGIGPVSLRQAAVVVGLASAFGGMVMVARLAADTFGAEVRTRAVALLALWPGSLALTMYYSDGLLLLFGSACLLFLRKEKWLLAGLAAALATASRPTAVALGPACLFAAVMAWRRSRSLLPFVAPALAPVGALAYFGFLWARFGDFFLWFEAERVGWGGDYDFGRYFLTTLVPSIVQTPISRVDLALSGVAGLLAIGLFVWALRSGLPGEQLVYVAVILVISLGAGFGAGLPRYVLNAFPLFFVPAKRLSDQQLGAWSVVSAGGLVLFTIIVGLREIVMP